MRKLARNQAGAAAIEFALIAPLFLLFTFGIFEFSRLIWTKQVVQRAAHSTVRCLSIGMDSSTSQCVDEAGVKAYAVAQAANGSVRIAAANVSMAKDVTCNGMLRQNQIVVTIPFQTAVPKILPMMPTEVSSTACFPDVSRLSKG